VSDLSFEIIGSRCELYAATPTLMLRLRITEAGGGKVHSVALRTQVQIDPRRRNYSQDEVERLPDLFGPPQRWGETLRSLLWGHVPLMVPGFVGSTEIDLPLLCTYDFEVGAAKYLLSLDDGEIPLNVLFSGSVFSDEGGNLRIDQVPWEREAAFRLPVKIWREVMDRYFPGTAWMRVTRQTLDALQRFKGRRALASWDEVIEALLVEAHETKKEKEPA
jgi:hypothetical protein